jgi:hypothetical protein
MSTTARNEPDGLLNRPLVMLALLFTIPASLVFLGYVYVVQSGPPPGGETSACERVVSDERHFRIERYDFSAGLTRYTDQRFLTSTDGTDWQEVMNVRVQNPTGVTCDDNIRQLAEDVYLLQSRKAIALSTDGGASWRVQGVCDAPRPEGRCDADALDMVEVTFETPQQGRITVREAVVDEYGVPQTEDGEIEVINRYRLITDDAGVTWQLEADDKAVLN